jgi:hypothetical protein
MAFQFAGNLIGSRVWMRFLGVMDSALRSPFKCQNTTTIDRLASSNNKSIFMSRKVFYGWLLRYLGISRLFARPIITFTLSR